MGRDLGEERGKYCSIGRERSILAEKDWELSKKVGRGERETS